MCRSRLLPQLLEVPAQTVDGAFFFSPAGEQLACKAQEEISDDVLNSDQFRMFCYKIVPCTQQASHDWASCPFAHPNEKAARRDANIFHYESVACPNVLATGKCPKGNACNMAHSVFEYWMHPQRYRTQICRDGPSCRRKVCFFAHSDSQLRHVPGITNDSPDPFSKKGLKKQAASLTARTSQEPCNPALTAAAASGSSSHLINCYPMESSDSSSIGFFDMMSPGCIAGSSSNSIMTDPMTAATMHLASDQPVLLSAAAAAVPHVNGSSSGIMTEAALFELYTAYQRQANACQQRAALAAAAADAANARLSAYSVALGMLPPNAAPTAAAAASPGLSNLLSSKCSLDVSGPVTYLPNASLTIPGTAAAGPGLINAQASLGVPGNLSGLPAAAAAPLSGWPVPSLELSGLSLTAPTPGSSAMIDYTCLLQTAAAAGGQYGSSDLYAAQMPIQPLLATGMNPRFT